MPSKGYENGLPGWLISVCNVNGMRRSGLTATRIQGGKNLQETPNGLRLYIEYFTGIVYYSSR
jgi:hypothetical protein